MAAATPPVLVINRAQDRNRLKAFLASAEAQGIQAERLPAHDAHRPDFPFALFSDLIGPHFWGSDHVKPGAIGCFLSHRAAWQTVLDRGWDAALIAEDDVALGVSTNDIADLCNEIIDIDILFANSRMADWAAASGTEEARPQLSSVLTGLSAQGGPKAAGVKPAPGADSYLITRRGAERLLAKTAALRIVCGVDWAMVWLALAHIPDQMAHAFPELAILRDHETPMPDPLICRVLTRPLSTQVPGPSALQHSVTAPIHDLTHRGAVLAHTEYVSQIKHGPVTLAFAGRSGPDPVMEAHRAGQLWDEDGLRLLLDHTPPGAAFVDVGAHIGNHTVAMARLGAAGTVLAIEANPDIHRIFQTNLAINGLEGGIELVEPGLALAGAQGQGWLVRNRRRSSETMVKAHQDPDSQAEPIRLIRGDDLLSGRPVDAIKIDTAGTEVDVLRGFSETLARHRPNVLIDHSEAAHDRIARLADGFDMRIARTVPSSRRRRVSTLLLPVPNRSIGILPG